MGDAKFRQLAAALGGARFYSITYRLFKLPGRIEAAAEDYGQAARYKASRAGRGRPAILTNPCCQY